MSLRFCFHAFFCFLLASPVLAQQAESAFVFSDFEEIEALAEIAENGSDPSVTMTRSNGFSVTLVRIEGVPAFAYRRDGNWRYGDYMSATFSCRGEGDMDITLALGTLGERPVPEEIDSGSEVSLYFSGLKNDAKKVIPNARIIEAVPEKSKGSQYSKLFQVRLSGPVDGPFFGEIAETRNLRAQVMSGKTYINLIGSVDLVGFERDLAPLLEHCRKTDPGWAPPPPSNEELADEEPVDPRIRPTEVQVAAAVERHMKRSLSIAGALIGQRDLNVRLTSLDLKRCVMTTDQLAFCEYWASPEMDNENENGFVGFMNAMMRFTGLQWGSFAVVKGRWELNDTYDTCDVRRTSINCTTRH